MIFIRKIFVFISISIFICINEAVAIDLIQQMEKFKSETKRIDHMLIPILGGNENHYKRYILSLEKNIGILKNQARE